MKKQLSDGKIWYKSKTLQGFGLLTVSVVLQQLGIIEAGVVEKILQSLLAFYGIVGLRDAL